MQLSSRILTALAVLILAVAVVAVRAGSPGVTVEAATGTIDVLNVGTCYTTNDDVFAVGDCNDGDGAYNFIGAATSGDASISEVGTVYATYSHDPKTAADNPRAILTNSDLVKISIQDTGRDKRTPVVLPFSIDDTVLSAAEYKVIKDVFGGIEETKRSGTSNTDVTTDGEGVNRVGLTAQNVIAFTDTDGETSATPPVAAGTVTYHLATDMYWGTGAYAPTGRTAIDLTTGVMDGFTVLIDADGADDTADTDDDVEYLPMFDADDTAIKFFGCIEPAADADATPPITAPTNACGDQDSDGSFQELKSAALWPDEDRGSGRTDDDIEGASAVAPWLNIQVRNANAVLQYIVYYTSERESLVGGIDDETESGTGEDEVDINLPDFTKSEMDGNTDLAVSIKSDGDAAMQNLWLYETGRFTGRYEGYARLTDADGDAGTTAADGTRTSNNWGLEVMAATGHDMDGAAVIGVESGPVVVEYRDTDGDVQTLSITIDNVPPEIQIDTPAHKSRDQDTSPEFAGSFNDGDSGLRQDSFQLYVDNDNDTSENGDNLTGTFALELAVNSMDTPSYGYVAEPEKSVRSIEDYMGYSAEAQFGVLEHTNLYGLADDANDADDKLLKVNGDRFSDGANNGTFADSVRIRIEESATDDTEVNPYNNTIDFHALVADVAGNIGFSDSDEAGPRFIYDYGKEKDRKTGRYNVLGWYARHIFFLDEKDPEIYREQSVTGFYGYNSDSKKPVVNRSGILIAFDSAVDADTISTDTFEVMLDPADAQDTSPAAATVEDVDVEGQQVYLLLSEELASDATPSVHIAAGESVSDPAGNRLTRGGLTTAVEVKDGIAPKLTVTLSGGSGTGEGNEASDKLTGKAMTITVASDENIQSTPSITVVCSNIAWDSDDDDTENDKLLADFTSARSGPIKDRPTALFTQPNFDCGDTKDRVVQQVQTFSRPGLEWEYQWQNFSDKKMLPDGKLTVVAYGRDRQSYASLGAERVNGTPAPNDSYNWGVATVEFNYDTTKPKLDASSKPDDGATVTDPRPFVLLNYDDKTTVSVTKLTINGTEQTEQVQTLGAKRFLYWPETLALGSHDVAIEAVDAAGNKSGAIERSFKVAERATFNIKLIAGWNAVSLPANPIDPDVASVFTEPIVDMVAAWNGEKPEAPWSIATRMEGEWSTHSDFATLNKIMARYGYWVHAQGFVTQSVALVGKLNRESPDVVPPDLVEIPTNPGWNFVGVVDQDGDQTQNNYGQVLKTGDTEVTADSYLGKHARAYRWDAIRSRFDVLAGDEHMKIGDGIWVYYPDGFSVAP